MRGVLTVVIALLPTLTAAQDFFTLKGHGGPIMGIAVDGNGDIATASFDNAVGVWTNRSPAWLDGHTAAVNTVLFVNGHVVSGGDDHTVRQWPAGKVIGHHTAKVTALAAAPGLVASASWDATIGLWPMDGSAPRHLRRHTAGVNDIAFSPDHRVLYSASTDGTLRVWDVASGQQQQLMLRHGFGINKIAVHPRAGWLAYGALDGVTRIVDTTTGASIADFTLGRRPVLALALSPDARRLAVGDGQGYIMVIDTVTWRIAHDFRATLRGPVWALAFAPDGLNLHAGGLDDAMYSWPVASLGQHDKMTTTERRFLQDPDKMTNGERQFARKCSICHTVTPGSARRAGPTLHGVFGRRAGTVADYRYSAILDRSGIVWDETSINALFDLGPDHYIPGSKMPMQRITDPADRADLIAYLRQATTKETDR